MATKAIQLLAEAGITEICLNWQLERVLDVESWAGPPDMAIARLDGLLASDEVADGRALVFRAPSRDVVVFDDCNDEARKRLEPFAFMVVETSPHNYHLWLRLDRPEAAMALQRAMEPTGANVFSNNGGRLPGFVNRKGNRRDGQGRYPLTRLVAAAPGRIASTDAMMECGLLGVDWRSAPVGPRVPIRDDTMLGTALAALANVATWRSVLISRWSAVSGRGADLPYAVVARMVTAAVFERQLDLIGRWRKVVALEHAVTRSPAAGSAILIFDRPTVSFRSVVLPILARRGLPATLFVNVDKLPPYHFALPDGAWDESHEFRRLGLGDLLALRDRGVELGVSIGNAHWTDSLGEIRGQMERGLRLFGPGPVPIVFLHDHFRPEALTLARDLGYYSTIRGGLSGLNPAAASPWDLRALHGGDWYHRDPDAFATTASGVRHLLWKMRRLAEPMP